MTTTAKHTLDTLVCHVTDGGAVYVADQHGFSNAKFIVRIDSDHNNYNTSKAMGALFASAPDLLSGCEAALAYLADPPSKFKKNRDAAVSIIRAAIAKAQGGAA